MHVCKVYAVHNHTFRVHTHPSSLAILTAFKSSILAVGTFRIWSWQHFKLAGLKSCSTIAVKVTNGNWSPSGVFVINAGHGALSTQSWYISQPIAQEERCDSVHRATNSASRRGSSRRGGEIYQYPPTADEGISPSDTIVINQRNTSQCHSLGQNACRVSGSRSHT